jgi:hypothetical protein
MAIIDFPASPIVGQTFTPLNGATYKWTGVLWMVTTAAAVLPPGVESMYSEHVLAAPGNALQTALPPSPFKRLTVQFFYFSNDGTNRQAGINIGGITTNNYYNQIMQSQSTAVGGIFLGPSTFWPMPGGWVNWGSFDFAYSPGGVHGIGNMMAIQQSGVRYTNTLAMDVPGTTSLINTIRSTYVDLTNFAAGSFMRAFYIP